MEVFTFLRIPISKEFLLEFFLYLFANTSVRKLFGFRSNMGIAGQAVEETTFTSKDPMRTGGEDEKE